MPAAGAALLAAMWLIQGWGVWGGKQFSQMRLHCIHLLHIFAGHGPSHLQQSLASVKVNAALEASMELDLPALQSSRAAQAMSWARGARLVGLLGMQVTPHLQSTSAAWPAPGWQAIGNCPRPQTSLAQPHPSGAIMPLQPCSYIQLTKHPGPFPKAAGADAFCFGSPASCLSYQLLQSWSKSQSILSSFLHEAPKPHSVRHKIHQTKAANMKPPCSGHKTCPLCFPGKTKAPCSAGFANTNVSTSDPVALTW